MVWRSSVVADEAALPLGARLSEAALLACPPRSSTNQAVASAHAARGLVMAIDEHYQISPAVEALLTREFEMVDEDYVRQKAQDLWSSAVEALAPVGDLAGTAMASAAKAITLEGISEGFRGLWTQDATEPPAWEQQGARVVRAGMLRGPMDDDDDISPWSSGAQSPAGAGPAKRLEPSFAKPGRAHEADDFPKAEDSEPEVALRMMGSLLGAPGGGVDRREVPRQRREVPSGLRNVAPRWALRARTCLLLDLYCIGTTLVLPWYCSGTAAPVLHWHSTCFALVLHRCRAAAAALAVRLYRSGTRLALGCLGNIQPLC